MIEKTETEMLLDAIEYAIRQGLLPDNENLVQQISEGKNTENQYVRDLATNVYIHYLAKDEINELAGIINLNEARGEQLDTIGELLGVARITSEPARVELLLTSTLLVKEDMTIPGGTKLLIIDSMKHPEPYVTSEDVFIPGGVEQMLVQAESINHVFQDSLEEECVVGLEGVEGFTVTNPSSGTNGRNIEEDDDYRERIKNWQVINERGSSQNIENYLSHYDGLDGFHLIPLYDGVGTLKIVADTLEGRLPRLQEDVYTNCMIDTDFPPLVVLPTSQTINLSVNVSLVEGVTVTEDEVRNMIINLTNAYVTGGKRRNGASWKGLQIGEDFAPALWLQFLMNEIPEIRNIYSSNDAIVPVGDLNKLVVGDVTVVFE